MKHSLEMSVVDGRTDGTEFIGPLSALPVVKKLFYVINNELCEIIAYIEQNGLI